uniref:NADH-ubiquinone oxidoreductase chain 5 n=1 Tax=Polypedates leucomystax TaxID=68444 RepID=A0A514YIQ1_POLLE|nr:NADH dehydrogenase subunit 5 [Polypedates leucomystax]QDK58655.1 NADH dehydrogenase subunit 5 [Polypedates leucomystax]UNH90317.1 NADH dehydrogenase subunit 5 [Polypedates leucomystax]
MAPALVIFIILLTPLLWLGKTTFPAAAKSAIKTAFFASLMLLTLTFYTHWWVFTLNLSWLSLNASPIPLMIQFDTYSLLFMTVAFFVSWSIMEFSMWYMHSDPNLETFMKYLLIFLMAMIILVSASNLFTLFIGWEGVGIMSYLLIGWFHGRANAATAAVQAVLYNRIGDIGFLAIFCWALKELTLTNMQAMYSFNTPTPILMAFILAAASKSAQFGLHPWLAAAMEGPTPVSALLHSSTMVVAGIFLMIRIHPIIAQNPHALTACLCLGALSTFYAAASALPQNDIKKVIAHSTSSQLGLMMVAIGINQPHLAFFHICTHAFFKAMLFLCAGLFIHSLNDEQDIRKMGGLFSILPMTTTSFLVGSLALMGTPFLSAFYSKDAIIETMNNSLTNSVALTLTLVATAFTAVYSIRLIYFVSLGNTRLNNPTTFINEYLNMSAVAPIIRLAYGSIFAGTMIFQLLTPNTPIIHTMSTSNKLAATVLTILAFILAFDIIKTPTSTKRPSKKLLDPSCYNFLVHRLSAKTTLSMAGHTISFMIESFMLKTKATSIMHAQKPAMQMLQQAHTGKIKTYLLSTTITLMMAYAALM